MAECIERAAAVKSVLRMRMPENSVAQNRMLSIIQMDILKLPAADVAPVVHGRWKYYHKQNKAVCTRCSFERDLDENFGAAISCPNCGAKME